MPLPVGGFRSQPKPDNEVVELLEKLLNAAREGYVRTVTVVIVNPVNKAEQVIAGDLGDIKANALLGGLTKATSEITKLL